MVAVERGSSAVDAYTPDQENCLIPLGGFGLVHGDLIEAVSMRMREIEKERQQGIYGFIHGGFQVRQDKELGTVIINQFPDRSGQMYLDEKAQTSFSSIIDGFKETHNGSVSP